MNRIAWLDNLRIMVIILVVVLHTGVTYSDIGGWYYVEKAELDKGSLLFFAFFQTYTQAFFMSMLFMVSGYFTAISLHRKGYRPFLSGRLKRLGIPLLVYMFIIHPITVWLAYPDMDLWEWALYDLSHLRFLAWTGPLWFVEALLIFTIMYMLAKVILRKWQINLVIKISWQRVALLIAMITAVAFFVRLIYPIGTNFYNLQFSFFSAYVFMFITGIFAQKFGLFEQLSLPLGKRYLLISVIFSLPVWFLIIIYSGALEGNMALEGGWNWPAFSYAFWESFFCVTFIIALAALFRNRCNISGRFQQFLSENAFGVFVFHAPILVWICTTLKGVSMHPLMKFAMVSFIALLSSFLFSWLVRSPLFLRRIFS